MNRKLFLCVIQWCGEPQWFDVTVIENTISTQRQQTPKMLMNNTASHIECPHSQTKQLFKSENMQLTRFFFCDGA